MYINNRDHVVVLTGKQELQVLADCLLHTYGRLIELGKDPWDNTDPFVKTLREMYFNLR